MKNRSILVTGGAGFIGSHLVDALVEQGACVKVVDDLSNGRINNVNKKAKFTCASIIDIETMRECIKGVELVFHLAAETGTKETSMGFKDPLREMRVNAEGTVNLLKCIADFNPSAHVVFASSAAVYGEPNYTPVDEKHPTEPVSPYGISKLASEQYVKVYNREFGIKSTIGRIFNTYGPRQSRYVIYDLIQKIKNNRNQLEILGNGSIIRDYAYVSDTVDALILISEKGQIGDVYNIAGGNPISISELSSLILTELDLEGKTAIMYSGASWKGDITKMIADITKLRKLGFKPRITLKSGIKLTLDFFMNH